MFHFDLGIDKNLHIASSPEGVCAEAPLLDLCAVVKGRGLRGQLIGVPLFLTPTGYDKYISARAMLAAAPAEGTVVSFGETDLFAALAYLCREAGRGLRYYMPDSLPIPAGTDSGVELRAVPSSDIRELRRAASESLAPGEVLLDEFRDESVVREYITTVGPAMLSACYGSLTDFVCPIGSGAAFTGLGKVFSALKDDIGLIAVEPLESPTLSTGRAGERAVEGMGYGIFPPLYDASMATEVIAVSEEARGKCLSELNDLISPELGPTSAAAVEAALRVLRMKNSDRTRVLVVLDS